MATEEHSIVVKTYRARNLTNANALLQAETQNEAWAEGCVVSSQAWAPGERTTAGIIFLILGVIGALEIFSPLRPTYADDSVWLPIQMVGACILLYYGLTSRALGTLSVTFARRAPESGAETSGR
jgi:hypothetical protein